MKKILLLAFVLFALSAVAQLKQEKRIELELQDGYTDEKVYEFGEKGFVIQSRKEELDDDGMVNWRYELYNTDLEKENEVVVQVSKRQGYDESYSDDNKIYTFFKHRKGEYTLVSLDVNTLKHDIVQGELPKKCVVTEMAVVNDYAYFASTIQNAPYVFAVNCKTGLDKPVIFQVPGAKLKHINLEKFQVLEKDKEVILHIYAYVSRVRKSYLMVLDDQGYKKSMFELANDPENTLTDQTVTKLGENEYILMGTYSTRSVMSEGIFFSRLIDEEMEDISYYKFTELNNFFSYLPERKQERIEKKKKRKSSKGKDFVLSYNIALHELVEVEGGYMLVGEAYYPTSHTITTTTMVNGAPSTSTQTIFDGYQYTHAFISKFSLDGKLEWSQSFEMWPSYKPFVVKRFVNGVVEKDQLKLLFANRSKIVTKVMNNVGEVITDKESESIETLYSEDKTKWTFSSLNYWYGNHFLIYGKQKIKNKDDQAEKRRRYVFFISKISFE